MRVLFCSPYIEGEDGGIYKWTSNILKYYYGIHDEERQLLIDHVSNENELSVYVSDSFFTRAIKGIRNLIPLERLFKQKIKKNHYDVVHLSSSASIGLIRDLSLIRIARKHKVKAVIHFHFGRIPDIFERKNWEYYLLSYLLKRIDHVIVMDQKSFEVLNAQGVRNLSFVPNPVSQEAICLAEKYEHLPKNINTILFIGHVLESKGVFDLVEACKDLDGFKLVFVGKIPSDDIKHQICAIASTGSVEVFFKGMLSYEDTIKELKASSLFVLPSHSEGFPNVVLEAMACSRPIISTTVGAIPQILDIGNNDPCGICVPPQCVGQLKDSIYKLIQDEEIAQRYAANAYERVMRCYTIDKVWEQLVYTWRKCLN